MNAQISLQATTGECRTDAAVDPIYLAFEIGAAVFFLVVEAVYLATAEFPFDGLKSLVGRDYVNTWMGARAALHGHPGLFFDLHRYNDILRQTFAAAVPEHNWSYPPHILLLIWPFGFFPYLTSYAIWAAIGFCLYLLIGSRGQFDMRRLLFLAASPVAFVNIINGQNGFFTAAMLVPAIWYWDRRPALSGVLFGVLTVKPQLILLIPIVLVLTKRWRCLAFACGTAVAMAGLTAIMFGPSIWTGYFEQAMAVQNAVMLHGTGVMLTAMPTPFMTARMLGLPLQIDWILQGIVSALSLAAVIWTFWRRRDPMLSAALLLTASLVFTPYAFNYDMAALTILLAQLRERTDNTRTDTKFILAIWVLPVVMMVVGLFGNVTGSALLLIGFGYRLIQRLREQQHTATIPGAIPSQTLSEAAA